MISSAEMNSLSTHWSHLNRKSKVTQDPFSIFITALTPFNGIFYASGSFDFLAVILKINFFIFS